LPVHVPEITHRPVPVIKTCRLVAAFGRKAEQAGTEACASGCSPRFRKAPRSAAWRIRA